MSDNVELKSKLVWGVGLYTPIDLGAVFKTKDLVDRGIEIDYHITALNSPEMILPRNSILDDIYTILGEDKYKELIGYCKDEEFRKVLSLFDLECMEHENDQLILKLRQGTEFYGLLGLINKGLKVKYKTDQGFKDYIPHITLAEFRKGEGQKYLVDPSLGQILEDSRIDFEDLMLSVESVKEKQIFLTHYKSVERFFRLEERRKALEELSKGEDLI